MSDYADEGTIAHLVAALCLEKGTDAKEYIGQVFKGKDYPHSKLSPSGAHRWMRCPASAVLERQEEFAEREFELELTAELAEHIQNSVDYVRERLESHELFGASAQLFIEQRVPIGHLTGEEKAGGTCDVIIAGTHKTGEDFLEIIDFKFGQGVEVLAEENEQLLMYASGAVEEFFGAYDFREITLTIHQPRKRSVSTWVIDAQRVEALASAVRAALDRIIRCAGHHLEYAPGEKQCRFCPAKATCPGLAEYVAKAVGDEFEDLNAKPKIQGDLSEKMDAVGLVDMWCKSVRAEVERRLLHGDEVKGYKLVTGKRGNRSWVAEDTAEAALKALRLRKDEMYSFSLISPTTAEKVLKDYPRKWKKLQEIIERPEGKPTVVPVSDKLPVLVIKPVIDEFENLTEE